MVVAFLPQHYPRLFFKKLVIILPIVIYGGSLIVPIALVQTRMNIYAVNVTTCGLVFQLRLYLLKVGGLTYLSLLSSISPHMKKKQTSKKILFTIIYILLYIQSILFQGTFSSHNGIMQGKITLIFSLFNQISMF